MVKGSILILFVCILLFGNKSLAQTYSAPKDSVESIHELYDPSEISNEMFLLTNEVTLGDELQFLYDDIERLTSQPPLPSSTAWKDLQQIPILTDLDIYKILKSQKGPNSLLGDFENNLQIFAGDTSKKRKGHVFIRSRAVLDPNAESQSEYQNGMYHGSPLKTISRIVAKSDDMLFALVEAKDPGEPLYFDHLTGCIAAIHALSLSDNISLSKLVLGDYSLSFGNGLLFSNNYLGFSTRDVTLNSVPHASGIQPYISSSSFRYFRGAAAEVTSGMLSVSGFFSDRMIDASIDSASKTITSFPSTGYHRTALELSRKDQAQSNVVGTHISLTPLREDNFLEVGATAYSLNYGKPVKLRDSLSPGFNGQKHSMISVEIRSAFSNISWSAEFAKMISDAGIANAFAATILGSPVDWLELSLNYHHLPNNFISPFGGTFGINASDAQNETGWYFAAKAVLIQNILSFFGSANSSESLIEEQSTLHFSDMIIGTEYRMKFLPLSFILQFRSYGKGRIFSITGDSLSKNSIRFDANGDLSKTVRISLRTEFERNYAVTESTTKGGYLVGIKMHYVPIPEFSVSNGIAFFNTDSYSSRFYSNEADLAGSAPFAALYGTGYRYYLQAAYKVTEKMILSARIAETRFSPTPGSPELHRATVGVQVDLAL